MEWFLLILLLVVVVVIVSKTGKKGQEKERVFRESVGKPLKESDEDVMERILNNSYKEKIEEFINKFIELGVEALTSPTLSKEERADVMNTVINSLDENAPEQSEQAQCDILRLAYSKLNERYSTLKDVDSVEFTNAKLEEIGNKEEVTNDDYSEIINFVADKNPTRRFVSEVYSSETEKEKKVFYEKFLEEYKDFAVEDLEKLIVENKKENYADYTIEDKQKWRAMKTIIERKTK